VVAAEPVEKIEERPAGLAAQLVDRSLVRILGDVDVHPAAPLGELTLTAPQLVVELAAGAGLRLIRRHQHHRPLQRLDRAAVAPRLLGGVAQLSHPGRSGPGIGQSQEDHLRVLTGEGDATR
jgi:hypothetical protein